MSSINYYNQNAKEFLESTFTADMESLLCKFTQHLPPKATLLDIGCGSGRDSLWFMNHGYDVWAYDGSEAMVNHCQKFLKERVSLASFEDYQSDLLFDGLWASASLLHVPRVDLNGVINKHAQMLKVEGVFYMSFKLRQQDHEKDGRQFTNMTKNQLEALINQNKYLEIIEIFETTDVRVGRIDEQWINAIARRLK